MLVHGEYAKMEFLKQKVLQEFGMCMCVYIHVYVHVYVCVHVCVSVCMCVHVCECVHVCVCVSMCNTADKGSGSFQVSAASCLRTEKPLPSRHHL